MDLLELLSITSLPSINSNSTTNSNHSDSSLFQIQIPMEANNLAQEAVAAVVNDVSGEGGGTGVIAEQQHRSLEEAKLPILSSSSSDSESEDPANNPTAGTSADNNGERVASPPPNCAICLGRCKNKCFTDSCMHQFCFKCLCEWSKVKPECPLCKQTFKSIIHNVKSLHQFEEYHVQPPTVQIAHPQFEMDFPQMRIFGVVQNLGRNDAWNDRVHRPLFIYPNSASNNGGSTSGNVSAGGSSSRSTPIGSLRNQYVYRGELLDLYRQEYPDASSSNSTLTQLWRRYVYDRKLYALPVCDITGRFRDSSAQYYRDNPAQIHRLAPWINRDLQCLLRQTPHDVNTVLDSINTALSLMNILSPAFRRRLQTYLGNKTAHFIHELNNFARSPYDMIGYDRVVEYSPQSNEDVIIEFSSSEDSSDTNEINVADDSALATPGSASINAINLTIHNRLTSNGGRGVADSAADTGGSIRSVTQDGVNLIIDLRGDPEEASASAASPEEGNTHNQANQPAITVAENIDLTSGSSDECEFVLERKPPHLRTPEMVSLDSASDSDVVFVEESKPLSKTTFSTSEGEPDNDEAAARAKRPTTRSKITALIDAKRRGKQSTNILNNETSSSSAVYDAGASTSAALRLSIQQRSDRSRVRRTKCSLRNSRTEPDKSEPRYRGKRLPSESSHSSSSMASLADSTATLVATNTGAGDLGTSDSSSEEEYVVTSATAQKRNANLRKRRRIRKTKSNKCNSTSKSDSRKRKKPNDDDDTSGDEEDNGHMGKNFALVMAIGERQRREREKLKKSRIENVSDTEDNSEGENAWRLKAVNEPLRKQQQIALRGSNERKRRVRKSIQNLNEISNQQAMVYKCGRGERELHEGGEKAAATYGNCQTSSDESDSDNLKLIELKTKLTRKCSKENLEEATNSDRLQVKQEVDEDASSLSQNENDTAAIACTEEHPQIQEPPITPNDTNCNNSNTQDYDMHSSTDDDEDDNDHDDDHQEADLNVDQIDVHDNSQALDADDHVGDYHVNDQREDDHNENEYSNETTNLPSPMEQEEQDDDEQDEEEDGSETTINIPTSMNLSHEPNVFDGASMSTTTTDTILNYAAEQISSAAVNFYNPQQTFNTAVFVDENTSSNSSSSESSVSSTTTTTSSSNSNSSNTNGFMNYDLS